MKKQYISPSILEQTLQNSGVLCASGASSTLTIIFPGGTSTPEGGDAAAAF